MSGISTGLIYVMYSMLKFRLETVFFFFFFFVFCIHVNKQTLKLKHFFLFISALESNDKN